MTRSLGLGDFDAFFRELWGPELEPFPWQKRLLFEVSRQGWPSGLDLPTASGKTAVLDIAVFALALEADSPAHERRAPLRTIYVIDRRVVVDQAFERASHIANRLLDASTGVLGAVADRLRAIQHRDGAPPLIASVLRGGMPRESDWAKAPGQPCILVSTVDQVGSRLLFRGYGVTDSMRPVHAGLLGQDALYLLDEVHLSRPFAETLAAVRRFARQAEATSVARRLEAVPMSATPGTKEAATFTLHDDDLVHPVLLPRLTASKRVQLRPVETSKDESRARESLARSCVQEAAAQFDRPRTEVVAVIVNRVDTARRVARLAEQERARRLWDIHLVTGRMRPLDRNDLLGKLEPLVRAGRDRVGGSRVLVVSTQAIEAGADFDFDALISECASLDALRQRFGRVDRLGRLGQSFGTIVAGTGQLALDVDQPSVDPVYGEALERTWSWVNDPRLKARALAATEVA